MGPFIDASATVEEANDLARGFQQVANPAVFRLAVALLISAVIALFGAYRLFAADAVVEALAPGGAVYRPAAYVDGKRPQIPVAISEEMAALGNGAKLP